MIDGHAWQRVPDGAPNAVADGRGNTNLLLDPAAGEGVEGVLLTTAAPLALTNSYLLLVDRLAEETAWAPVALGEAILDRWRSDKPLGAEVDLPGGPTTFRLFAPRAGAVELSLYEAPTPALNPGPGGPSAEAYAVTGMTRDSDGGVWEAQVEGNLTGAGYAYGVDGPAGPGEGFDPLTRFADPYARAVAHARGSAILVNPQATNRWFGGWTDQAFEPPAPEDLVIYETHIRHFTRDPSSGVAPELRGRFAGVAASLGTGTGLDHLKQLGVNAIELMPVQEFDNGVDDHNWGYATAFFFAPEASYGRAPLEGSQYYEFNQMVNDLHRQGFAVILDVVYNHAGHPNVFQLTDRPYFFRLRPDLSYENYSGVGNDFRTEAPMMRRLIVENVLYWMQEHHVDGFRFDLGELIDLETLMQVRDAARAVNPDVILISEPWSLRGNHKHQLRGTGWASWNDDFRNLVKGFVTSGAERGALMTVIGGTVEAWTETPMQSINYLESHDDMALADEFSTAPGRDGRTLIERDVRLNRLAATMLMTSLGIPMIGEGQEFLRSKHGIRNTYNRGDEVNALHWNDRDRPRAEQTLAYYRGLIALRQSEAGRSFRVRERPPSTYIRWALPLEPRAITYVVNVYREREGAPFAVMVNAADRPVDFTFHLPEGRWRMVGDGERIRLGGWPEHDVIGRDQPVTFTVPALTAHIYRHEG